MHLDSILCKTPDHGRICVYSDNVIGILHNASITLDGVDVDDLTGTALYDEADQLYNQYWRNNSLSG